MKLSSFYNELKSLESIEFKLPNGNVPNHFHLTELGLLSKNYIDCGGNKRDENFVSFQLWYSHDFEHRLKPEKLQNIISSTIERIDLPDYEIRVEYQGAQTVEIFEVEFENGAFILKETITNCQAKDACGIPTSEKPRIKISDLNKCC